MTAPKEKLWIQGAMLSDVGCTRSINEDSVAFVIPRAEDAAADRGVLAVLADGMGGHAAGELASIIATDMIVCTYYASSEPPATALATAFRAANEAIYARATAEPEFRGMGSTCTALAIRSNRVFLAHVGDSRAYLLRGAILHQLSEDHSLVTELLRAGTITREEAASHPERNVILRALGTRPQVEVALWTEGLEVTVGDVLLLCSDGLTDLVEDTAIARCLAGRAPREACRVLIDAALAAGGSDNVSVGVFVVGDAPPKPTGGMRPTRSIKVKES